MSKTTTYEIDVGLRDVRIVLVIGNREIVNHIAKSHVRKVTLAIEESEPSSIYSRY